MKPSRDVGSATARISPNQVGTGRIVSLLVAAAVSLPGFLLGTPYALLDFPAFAADFRTQLGYGADPWFGQQAQPSSYIFLSSLIWGFGLLPMAMAAIGSLRMAHRKKALLVLLLSVPISYFLFMSTLASL